jgi:hypothetical protein
LGFEKFNAGGRSEEKPLSLGTHTDQQQCRSVYGKCEIE